MIKPMSNGALWLRQSDGKKAMITSLGFEILLNSLILNWS